MALADNLALYALGYWTHEHHPMRIDALCLNTAQKKSPCTACSDICPADINLNARTILWGACTNCNLCVTACPTAAINQSSTSFANVRRLIQEGNAPVSFACERNEGATCDVRCLCLAAVPWDLVAAAALSSGVVLKLDPCKDCPHEGMVRKVKRLVRDVRDFLGEEQFKERVFMHDQAERLRSSGTDKRLAMESIARSVGKGAENLLVEQETPTMSCYRALLMDVLGQAAEEGAPFEVGWQVLAEDGGCRACEICTKMCPHKALELRVFGYTEDVGEDEPQTLVQNASKCTQCGLCYVSCPQENLGGWDRLRTTDVPAYLAHVLDVQLCEKCKRPFKPTEEGQTLCQACGKPKLFGRKTT